MVFYSVIFIKCLQFNQEVFVLDWIRLRSYILFDVRFLGFDDMVNDFELESSLFYKFGGEILYMIVFVCEVFVVVVYYCWVDFFIIY